MAGAIILGLIGAAGAWLAYLVFSAPDGYEDCDGFHLGVPDGEKPGAAFADTPVSGFDLSAAAQAGLARSFHEEPYAHF